MKEGSIFNYITIIVSFSKTYFNKRVLIVLKVVFHSPAFLLLLLKILDGRKGEGEKVLHLIAVTNDFFYVTVHMVRI